jgi:predicted CoA-binding protein
MRVAVLGASSNPERTAFLAVQRLRGQGHEVVGVNPRRPDLGGVPLVATLAELPPDVDTLTVYVAPARTAGLIDEIVERGIRRVIFNPGSENPVVAQALRERGVEVLEACTLVMLATGRFA